VEPDDIQVGVRLTRGALDGRRPEPYVVPREVALELEVVIDDLLEHVLLHLTPSDLEGLPEQRGR